MVKPNLIHRCQIQKMPENGDCFSDCISTEYMGSTEFELGTLAKVLLSLSQKKLVVTRVELDAFEIDPMFGNKVPVKKAFKFLSTEDQVEEYKTILADLKAGKIRTKEYVFSSFADSKTDLWVDYDNEVIFTTDKMILNRMESVLQASAQKVLKNREIHKFGEELIKKHYLNDFPVKLNNEFGGTFFIGYKDMEENGATQEFKGKTQHPGIIWVNDASCGEPRAYLGGYYTVEQIEEYMYGNSGGFIRDRHAERTKEYEKEQTVRRAEKKAEDEEKKRKRDLSNQKRRDTRAAKKSAQA